MLNSPHEQAVHGGRSGPCQPVIVNGPISALTSVGAAAVPVVPTTDCLDAVGDSMEMARC